MADDDLFDLRRYIRKPLNSFFDENTGYAALDAGAGAATPIPRAPAVTMGRPPTVRPDGTMDVPPGPVAMPPINPDGTIGFAQPSVGVGPGATPGVLGVPPNAPVTMPDGGPGLGGFGTVKPTGNPKKADEDSWWAKVLKMSQDKNFMGALDALGLGAGKAPEGSPPKIPKYQMSPASPLRPYPTVTNDAGKMLAGATPPAVDLRTPVSKNAALQKRYDILNKRQTGITQLLQELG